MTSPPTSLGKLRTSDENSHKFPLKLLKFSLDHHPNFRPPRPSGRNFPWHMDRLTSYSCLLPWPCSLFSFSTGYLFNSSRCSQIFSSKGNEHTSKSHSPVSSHAFSTSLPPRLYSLFSLHFSSVAQSCLTLCNLMDCSKPGLPVHHQLPEFTQTHVHWVGDAIQPSHPISSPSPPVLNLSQHQGLFKWVHSSHQVAKVLESQLQHQSFQWTFTTDFL